MCSNELAESITKSFQEKSSHINLICHTLQGINAIIYSFKCEKSGICEECRILNMTFTRATKVCSINGIPWFWGLLNKGMTTRNFGWMVQRVSRERVVSIQKEVLSLIIFFGYCISLAFCSSGTSSLPSSLWSKHCVCVY